MPGRQTARSCLEYLKYWNDKVARIKLRPDTLSGNQAIRQMSQHIEQFEQIELASYYEVHSDKIGDKWNEIMMRKWYQSLVFDQNLEVTPSFLFVK